MSDSDKSLDPVEPPNAPLLARRRPAAELRQQVEPFVLLRQETAVEWVEEELEGERQRAWPPLGWQGSCWPAGPTEEAIAAWISSVDEEVRELSGPIKSPWSPDELLPSYPQAAVFVLRTALEDATLLAPRLEGAAEASSSASGILAAAAGRWQAEVSGAPAPPAGQPATGLPAAKGGDRGRAPAISSLGGGAAGRDRAPAPTTACGAGAPARTPDGPAAQPAPAGVRGPQGDWPAEWTGQEWLSCGDLADIFGVGKDALRKRLERWRAESDRGYRSVENRGSRQPRYLYNLGALWHVLRDLRASGNRPSDDEASS
jgi:hypothetical protein